MTARNLTYFKINTWRRGAPTVNKSTGELRKTKGVVYNKSVVASLAYRGCCKLVDAITGTVHNYGSKNHLLAEIFATPKECGWSKDRQKLASAMETAEKRKDSRVGREIVIVCPDGMNPNTFISEVTAYAHWLQKRYRTTIVADIHDPHKDNPNPPKTGRNLHVHITVPTREVTPQGMGVKLRELDDLNYSRNELNDMRKEWARAMKRGFEQQGENIEFDERSYAKRGIDRTPEPKLGPAANAMHQRGLYSDRWALREEIRAENKSCLPYLQESKIAQTKLEENIRNLEKLSNQKLSGTSCLIEESHWSPPSWKTRHHLDISTTLKHVEKLNSKVPIFEELITDMRMLKKRCNAELDYEPKIEDVPTDTCIEDLFILIGQELSNFGLARARRGRERPRDRSSLSKSELPHKMVR
ncbi:MAG: MobA/MobL family protein [Opitutaceae bacterium]